MCCRGRGLVAQKPMWAPIPTQQRTVVPSGPALGVCYYVDVQGDFLPLSVTADTFYIMAGSEPHEARAALRSCASPRAGIVLNLIERAYASNQASILYAMLGSKIFTLSFLRSQVGP